MVHCHSQNRSLNIKMESRKRRHEDLASSPPPPPLTVFESPKRFSSARKKSIHSPMIRVVHTEPAEPMLVDNNMKRLMYQPIPEMFSEMKMENDSMMELDEKLLSKKLIHKGIDSSNSSSTSRRRAPPPLLTPNLIVDDDVIVPSVSGRGGKRRDQGLRTLSFKICSILQDRKLMNYEELIMLLQGSDGKDKRFRRRVYDTMKVLKATDVIDINEDSGRELSWNGLPNSVHPDVLTKMAEIEATKERIAKKKESVKDMAVNFVAHHRLLAKNSSQPVPRADAKNSESFQKQEVLYTPFMVLKAPQSSDLDISMDNDSTQILVNCASSFSLLGSPQIVSALNPESISPWDLHKILPEELISFYPKERISSSIQNAPSPKEKEKPKKSPPKSKKAHVK
jgi:hypothetical protein